MRVAGLVACGAGRRAWRPRRRGDGRVRASGGYTRAHAARFASREKQCIVGTAGVTLAGPEQGRGGRDPGAHGAAEVGGDARGDRRIAPVGVEAARGRARAARPAPTGADPPAGPGRRTARRASARTPPAVRPPRPRRRRRTRADASRGRGSGGTRRGSAARAAAARAPRRTGTRSRRRRRPPAPPPGRGRDRPGRPAQRARTSDRASRARLAERLQTPFRRYAGATPADPIDDRAGVTCHV